MEAQIIAQAGCKNATISTNTGRGTDIILGGNVNSQIADLGDDASENKLMISKPNGKSSMKRLSVLCLHVIGAERNESRRIDNQLLGRAGRQGDPGSSQFYLAIDMAFYVFLHLKKCNKSCTCLALSLVRHFRHRC